RKYCITSAIICTADSNLEQKLYVSWIIDEARLEWIWVREKTFFFWSSNDSKCDTRTRTRVIQAEYHQWIGELPLLELGDCSSVSNGTVWKIPLWVVFYNGRSDCLCLGGTEIL